MTALRQRLREIARDLMAEDDADMHAGCALAQFAKFASDGALRQLVDAVRGAGG